MIRRLTSFSAPLQIAITLQSDGEVALPGDHFPQSGGFNESSLAIPVNGSRGA
jgi:hypothetical protein